MKQKIENDFYETSKLLSGAAAGLTPVIEKAANAMIESYKAGGRSFFFGNGGSAADAQHLATEMVCRFKKNRKALPAIALTTDTSLITAISNDFSFDSLFERQVEAFVKKGDVVVGISTSGCSENVKRGLQKAQQQGAVTIAFLGKDGGNIKNDVDISIIVPSDNTPRIQECHILIGHILCDLVEQTLFSDNK